MSIVATLTPSIHSLAPRHVNLRFDNIGHQGRYLAAKRIGQVAFDGSYFQFSDPNVCYLGEEIKQRPYTQEELILLSPGTHVEYGINLQDYYEIKDCQGLVVGYQAAHPILESGAVMEIIESNKLIVG